MHIDFLDIGTSDFDIGDGHINANKKYLLVEPVVHYLNNLPNHSNIIKANFAISDTEGDISVFYIDEYKIKQYNLPDWVRGCNKINSKHPTVLRVLQERNLSEDIITEKIVKCITFKTLIHMYGVTSITHLKIDTEGHDHVVLQTIVDCLKEIYLNIETIKIEYLPVFGNTDKIDSVAEKLKTFFPVQQLIGENLHLRKYTYA
jgi:FkbM family methyltransferase